MVVGMKTDRYLPDPFVSSRCTSPLQFEIELPDVVYDLASVVMKSLIIVVVFCLLRRALSQEVTFEIDNLGLHTPRKHLIRYM